MSVLDKLIKENFIYERVNKGDYEKAKNEFSVMEFEKFYFIINGVFYKRIFPAETEITAFLLNDIKKSLRSISSWIMFIGIFTTICIISTLVILMRTGIN